MYYSSNYFCPVMTIKVFQTMVGVVAARHLVILSKQTKQATSLASASFNKVSVQRLLCFFADISFV